MTDKLEINKTQNQSDQQPKSIKIRTLKIINFKGLDDIEINFPPPQLKGDPDIIVMGSRNGLGKTSVLESCGLLFLAAYQDLNQFLFPSVLSYISDLLIKAGKREANISGDFSIGNNNFTASLEISRSGQFKTNVNRSAFQEFINQDNFHLSDNRNSIVKFFYSLGGLSTEPTILPHFIYFHSYRKIQEGSPELAMILEENKPYTIHSKYGIKEELLTISTFKLEILRSLMSRSGLFENIDDTESEKVLGTLNRLMKQYASGTIEKLRPSHDNTIEFRVTPTDGSASFTFDGLSSGQKEIISTLFLIWKYTDRSPGIVLIDEPELHLNPEWHRRFIHNLYQLAPNNQYIIATHSEDIFASVESDRRIILSSDED